MSVENQPKRLGSSSTNLHHHHHAPPSLPSLYREQDRFDDASAYYFRSPATLLEKLFTLTILVVVGTERRVVMPSRLSSSS